MRGRRDWTMDRTQANHMMMTVGTLAAAWRIKAEEPYHPFIKNTYDTCAYNLTAALVPIREQVARLEQEIRAGEFIGSVKDMMEGVEKILVENMLALIADELAAIKKALEP